jgi:hypothetical protein
MRPRFFWHRPDYTGRLWIELHLFGWIAAVGLLKGNHVARLAHPKTMQREVERHIQEQRIAMALAEANLEET